MFLFVPVLPADYTVDKKNHTTVTTVFPKIGKMSRLLTSPCAVQCFTVCRVACVCEQEVQVWPPRFFWGLCWSACSSFSPWPLSSTSNAPTASRTSSTAATKVNTVARHCRSSFRPVALLLRQTHGMHYSHVGDLTAQILTVFFIYYLISSSVHFPTKWNSKLILTFFFILFFKVRLITEHL